MTRARHEGGGAIQRVLEGQIEAQGLGLAPARWTGAITIEIYEKILSLLLLAAANHFASDLLDVA